MFNYHKYGFLDVKKLYRYINEESFWLVQFDPVYLFVNSDLYKPEIAYTNEFVIIRYIEPGVGLCYFPPIGNGDLRWLLSEIEAEAIDLGYDFNISVCDEYQKRRLEKFKINLYETERFNSYIYQIDNIAFYRSNKLRNKKKLLATYIRNNPQTFYRHIKKEDFPSILEFIGTYNEELKLNQLDVLRHLNKLKKLMDHLYELDLLSIIIMDEEKIHGIAIGSLFGNVINIQCIYALPSNVGSYENVLNSFARICYTKASYLSLGFNDNKKEKIKELEAFDPYKIEKYYSTFNI